MNGRMIRKTTHILGLLLLFLFAMPVLAQEPTVTDDDVNEVAKDLFCPVCESTPLDVCPTQACADWRELIRTQLTEGKTKDEVHEYFARQYGDGVLADPPKRGFNLILWVLPVLAVLGGGFLFWRYLHSLRAAGQAPVVATTAAMTPVVKDVGDGGDQDTAVANSTTPAKDENTYINQVEEELRKL